MALKFQHHTARPPAGRVALFPGAYNPPTVAHLAMARSALRRCDEVIWVLPRAFPHKGFEGVGLADRLEMLTRIASGELGFSSAVSDGGLYLEIAEEARRAFGPKVEIELLCGRDAAERIAGWDYGRPGVFEELILRFPLLVAGRAGEFVPEARHAERIISLAMESPFNDVSSTEVRRRIEAGEPWQDLVPESIADLVARLYAGGAAKLQTHSDRQRIR